MVLAIAAEMDWEVRQLDVKTAFLYADIEEEVFVAEPPGFETNDNEKGLLVMKLGKSLYGLAQSPGNWFHTIDPVLISIGFVPLKSDTCIYIYNHDGVIIILTLYVDDLLVIGGDIQLIEKIRSKLMEKFKMTDMGDVSLVLGMQITRDREKKTLTIRSTPSPSWNGSAWPTANLLVLQALVQSFQLNNRKRRCSARRRLRGTKPLQAR